MASRDARASREVAARGAAQSRAIAAAMWGSTSM